MNVRHLTAADNVREDGSLIDALAVRHGLIVAGRVSALAGLVDPLTHLNADFTEHGLEQCAIVEQLAIGAAAHFDEDGLKMAWAADSEYQPLGRVDVQARLRQWRSARAARVGAMAEAPVGEPAGP
jgi:hypothetical protein